MLLRERTFHQGRDQLSLGGQSGGRGKVRVEQGLVRVESEREEGEGFCCGRTREVTHTVLELVSL